MYCVSSALSCNEFNLKQAADKFANSSAVYFGACSKWAHWTILAKWHSAASSNPCDSAHACKFLNLHIQMYHLVYAIFKIKKNKHYRLNSFTPKVRVQSGGFVMIVESDRDEIQWNNCENSCIVKAAFTLHFLNKFMAELRTFIISLGWSSAVSDIRCGIIEFSSSVRQATRFLKYK